MAVSASPSPCPIHWPFVSETATYALFSWRAAFAPPSPLWSFGRLQDSARFSEARSIGEAHGSFVSSLAVPALDILPAREFGLLSGPRSSVSPPQSSCTLSRPRVFAHT